MAPSHYASYRFGPFELVGDKQLLLCDGKETELKARAVAVLQVLLGHQNELLTYDKLIVEVWASTHVARHTLVEHVRRIREVLEKEGYRRYLETDKTRGYRFNASDLPGGVKTMLGTPASEAERLSIIAIDQTNVHSGPLFRTSIKNCEEALQTGGPNAEAYVTMAKNYVNLGMTGFCLEHPGEVFPKAKDAVDLAIHYFSATPSAYAWRGLIALISDYAWDAAEKDFNQALRRDPQDEYGNLFLALWQISRGLFREGLKHVRIAAEVGFERGMTVVTEPWCMLFAGQLSDALRTGELVAERFGNMAPVHDILGHIYQAAGAEKKAIAEYKTALGIEFVPDPLGSLGYLYGKRGDRKAALRYLQLLREAEKEGRIAYMPAYYEALIFAGLNDKKRCLDALEKACEQKCDWLIFLKVEPRWAAVRNEKRFVRLLERVGLPATSASWPSPDESPTHPPHVRIGRE
ncbi:MAG TPA: winged helix-turn-helix domain-containing protein [Bacteroidota bacterium]|nr:winged helix-turn-helix domain-containing protein [Bacteroidota bacterium]